MVENELTKAIRDRATEILSLLVFPTDSPNDEQRAPTVINGFLPPKRSKDDPDFPFVIVRPGEGTTGSDGMSRVTVKMLIGCFSEDFDGHEYGLIVLAQLRTGFMQHPTLESRFRMELPFNWKLYDDQPYPEWMIEITTQWTIPTPQEIPDEGVTGYATQEQNL